MAKIFIGFVICIFLSNCSKKENQKENIHYIISKESKGKITGNDTIPPTLPIPG